MLKNGDFGIESSHVLCSTLSDVSCRSKDVLNHTCTLLVTDGILEEEQAEEEKVFNAFIKSSFTDLYH